MTTGARRDGISTGTFGDRRFLVLLFKNPCLRASVVILYVTQQLFKKCGLKNSDLLNDLISQLLFLIRKSMLKGYYHTKWTEAGCDEAGRGCLAGPVFAAAVILPKDFYHPLLNDSKQVVEEARNELRVYIRKKCPGLCR